MKFIFFQIFQWLLHWQRNRLIVPAVRGCTVVGDFGCGHYASRFATVRIDKADTEDEQRGFLGLCKKPFVDWDLNVYPWPFADKHFDYAICTQVLEHLQDPVRACKELSRVAKAGYIEVPYWCVDVFIRNADPIHVSLCSVAGGELCFWDRTEFIKRHPPCQMPIAMRFLMQAFREIRVAWDGEIKARRQ